MQQVVAGVMVHRGRVLVGTRGPAAGDRKGLLQFPGGKVERNEALDKAVKREFFQETGFGIFLVHKLCSSILVKPNGKEQNCTFFLIVPDLTQHLTGRMFRRWEARNARVNRSATIKTSGDTLTIDFASPPAEHTKCNGWTLVKPDRLVQVQNKLVDSMMIYAAWKAMFAHDVAVQHINNVITRYA